MKEQESAQVRPYSMKFRLGETGAHILVWSSYSLFRLGLLPLEIVGLMMKVARRPYLTDPIGSDRITKAEVIARLKERPLIN